ncbi:ATP-binding cassette domain-containing protein, partial [Vibrio genomosp. F10]|uniref:ATP-binding cassette domain-containing protein n=1 Tax=Vibrio genomosp. F10 TaxID=723171 RepID=UPI00114D3406
VVWLSADGVGGNPPDPFIALVAFATMASFELLMPIAGAFQHLGQTLTSARRLNEVTLSEPDVVFSSEKQVLSDAYSIQFQSISFQYPGSEQLVLNNINLDIASNERIAIVGQTGSGKSTLLQLLNRYWDPKQGRISIAGLPLTQWNESQLRSSVSVVSQRVDILNGTLRDNLLMANPSAHDDTLSNVLNQVQLDKLLEDLGLDAWLGDGGRQLSGGEKRRIGIARAILHNAPILLLDEPTEGLDKQTEQQIMDLLESHFVYKTVLFVTHRLVNLHKMDRVCLVEQGEIVEVGSHQTLLEQRGRYFELTQTL